MYVALFVRLDYDGFNLSHPLRCVITLRRVLPAGGEFGWVRFLVVCFQYKTNPNPQKKYFLWEKVAEMPLFNLFFLGLGWPWVGELVGFIKILTRYVF